MPFEKIFRKRLRKISYLTGFSNSTIPLAIPNISVLRLESSKAVFTRTGLLLFNNRKNSVTSFEEEKILFNYVNDAVNLKILFNF